MTSSAVPTARRRGKVGGGTIAGSFKSGHARQQCHPPHYGVLVCRALWQMQLSATSIKGWSVVTVAVQLLGPASFSDGIRAVSKD